MAVPLLTSERTASIMKEAQKTQTSVEDADVAKAADQPKMARGTVAKGRTVLVPGGETRTVGFTPAGEKITRVVEVPAGPGREVILPAHEIEFLKRAGFLIDPSAAALNYDVGPTFERQG